eukprot:854-Heterococcus_DN1.PRE.1
MKMYNGAVEIAQGAGVGVLPVTLRYNMPVGLDKMDCPLSNAIQVMNVSGKRVSVNFGAVMQPASIEEVRAEITKAYTSMD